VNSIATFLFSAGVAVGSEPLNFIVTSLLASIAYPWLIINFIFSAPDFIRLDGMTPHSQVRGKEFASR
jgi:hypothetical protein